MSQGKAMLLRVCLVCVYMAVGSSANTKNKQNKQKPRLALCSEGSDSILNMGTAVSL